MKLFLPILLCSLVMIVSPIVYAEKKPLRLAVSANFAPALNEVVREFSARTGIPATVTVASSGTLFAQIRKGAPFDVFLSADARRPHQLVSEHLADADSLITYAVGQLAYVSNDKNINDVDSLIAALSHNPMRLAIAHPDLAPYGKAAQQFLRSGGLEDDYAGRLIRGKNVLQAWQYFETGNVSQALIAASLVADIHKGKVIIPSYLHDDITQKLVIPLSSDRKADAMRFICFLVSESVQKSLQETGYKPVNKPEVCT